MGSEETLAPNCMYPEENLRIALKKYGQHLYHECNHVFVYDTLNPDFPPEDEIYDGSGHWERRGEVKECRCGLAQALQL